MTLNDFQNDRLKRDIITFLVIIALLFLCGRLSAQTTVPDTAVTIKTTNNELYRLNAILSFAANEMDKNDPVIKHADLKEFEKQVQALLGAWFRQKEQQAVKPKPPAK